MTNPTAKNPFVNAEVFVPVNAGKAVVDVKNDWYENAEKFGAKISAPTIFIPCDGCDETDRA